MLVAHHDGRAWGTARIIPAGSDRADLCSGAIQYGLSAFEGLKAFRAVDGSVRLFRADAHGARFAKSADALCMPPVPVEMFVSTVAALVREDASWCPPADRGAIYIRPTLFATEAFLGVRPSNTHSFAVILSPVDAYFGAGARQLRLWAERERVRACPGGVGWVKTGGNYAASLLAAKQAQARGYDQVLWLDAKAHEHVEEAGTMNVFVRIDDVVYTPPLTGTILAGITRDCSLTLLRKWGVKVEERAVSLTELAAAGSRELEIWGTGTAAVIASVGEVGWEGGSVRSNSTTVSTRLNDAITGVQSGRLPDEFGWLSGPI